MLSSPAPQPRVPLAFPLLGDRVLLRPFETTDVPAAHAAYGDEEVMRYVGAGGAVPPEETARMIAGYRRHQHVHGFACWAVPPAGSRSGLRSPTSLLRAHPRSGGHVGR